MFLFRLSRPVVSSYSTGAAMGISQELASVPASSIPTQEDARSAKSNVLLEEIRRIPFGEALAESISRSKLKRTAF